MKRLMSYAELDLLIESKIEAIKSEHYDEIIAVVRGGLTAAHLLAKKLRLPVGCYYPATSERQPFLFTSKLKSKKILFVEDLVAQGRTYSELQSHMKDTDYEWDFFPVLVDASYPHDFRFQGLRTSDWIVFPYEEESKVIEGDRGLFRVQTDAYGIDND